jgi:hypothetical protein
MRIQAFLTAAAVNLKRLAAGFAALLVLVCTRANALIDKLATAKRALGTTQPSRSTRN